MTEIQEQRAQIFAAFNVETVTVRDDDRWPEGFTVTLRPLTYGETKKLAADMVKGMKGDDLQNFKNMIINDKISTNMVSRQAGVMLASIMSWTFKYTDGTPMPLDQATLDMLPEHVTTFIEQAIEELNPQPGESFQDTD